MGICKENNKVAWAEINLLNMKQNMDIIESYAGKGKTIGAIVKADAYGLGASEIVKSLSKEDIVQMFIVGKVEEAEELAIVSNEKPILVLDRMGTTTLHKNMDDKVIYSAYNIDFIQKLQELGEKEDRVFQVHIRVDVWGTGMGFLVNEVTEELFSFSKVEVIGIYTHLHSSYQYNWEKSEEELCRFDKVIDNLPENIREKITVHAQNSPLIFTHSHHNYDMVRSGTAIYGLPCNPKDTYGLKPLLTLKSRIVNITEIKAECTISYKQKKSNKDCKIARFLLGYWDCPFLMTQENVKVWVNGKLYSVAEEPCMDSTCIEVEEDEISVGDEVILLGEEMGVSLRELLARHQIDLVHSERLYIMSKRLHKVYYS